MTTTYPNALRELVDRFEADRQHFESREFNEDEVRASFIDPLLELLGWDIRGATRGGRRREVLLERSMARAGVLGNQRPDYTIQIHGRPQFVVEAKAAYIPLDEPRHIFQLKSYAWSLGVPFAILTNFARTRVYDCRIRPEEHRPTAGLINELDITFRDYPVRWRMLSNLFSRDAVVGGALQHLELFTDLTVQTGRRNEQLAFSELTGFKAFDESFLNDLEQWRKRLADSIYKYRPTIDEPALRFVTQRLLDKLIFIRVVEDRNIRRGGDSLKSIVNTWRMHRGSLFDRIYAVFDEYNRDFDGALFRPHTTDALRFDEALLEELIDYFYFPRPYRFDAIELDVLGSIYERFIGRHLVICADENRVAVEHTPDTRHLSGVYYTPQFIVERIVDDALGDKLRGRTPQQILRLRILDPACGSGAFLIGAFLRLCDELAEYYEVHPRSIRIRSGVPDYASGHLSPIAKAEVALSCLRGVDKDPQAVEVTILSLSLAILDERYSEEMAWTPLISALPDLTQIVFNYNTLIGEDYALASAQNNITIEADCVPLDPTKIEDGTFDAVIGNPPYVRLRNIIAYSPSQAAYIRGRFASMGAGNPDLCLAFVERGLAFLKRDGVLEYIISSRFFVQDYGKALRDLLGRRRVVRSIVNFLHHRVFRGLSTYTALLKLTGRPANSISYQESFSLTRVSTLAALQRRLTNVVEYPATTLGREPWRLLSTDALAFTQHMDRSGVPLWAPGGAGFAKSFFVGPQTSLDAFFICTVLDDHGPYLKVSSNVEPTPFQLEKSGVRAIISGTNAVAYGEPVTDKVVITPYAADGSLVDLNELQGQPYLWRYYLRHEAELRGREADGNNRPYDNETWFRWGYPKNTTEQFLPKLTVPGIVRRLRVGYDSHGGYVLDNVDVCGIILRDQDPSQYFYLLSILNSKPLNTYWRIIATPYQNSYFRANKQVSRHLPIALYDDTSPLIRELSRLGQAAFEITSRPNAAEIQRQLGPIVVRIDELVMDLYEVPQQLRAYMAAYLDDD